MRFLAALSLILPAGPAAADAPKEAPRELQGAWRYTAAKDGRGGLLTTAKGGGKTLTITGGKAEWEEVPLLLKKPGKGTVEVDATRSPPTIALKGGGAVLKGIYRLRRNGRELEILFSEPGGDFPKGFGPGLLGVPEGFKGAGVGYTREK